MTANSLKMLAVTCAFAAAGPLLAQEEPVAEVPAASKIGGDFTFRRVSIPQQGVVKRINVQIDPNADLYRLTPEGDSRRPGDARPEEALNSPVGTVPDGLVPEGANAFGWYWDVVSPASGVDAALRFRDAVSLVERSASRVGTPRLQSLRRIAESHGVDILTSTIGTDVSPALVLAVIAVESAGRSDAVSHAGAQGLMQLMPGTAKRFGVTNSMDARQNIRGGVAYLDWLLKEFNRDPVLALAGYNAGEGAVTKHQGVPPYEETRGYVPKVLAAWTIARGLCLTPPELVTDGCVFVGSQMVRGG